MPENARQQAATRTNVDPDLWRRKASLDYNICPDWLIDWLIAELTTDFVENRTKL